MAYTTGEYPISLFYYVLAAVGSLLVFVRVIYTWFKDFDNSQVFIQDMAQIHLPYIFGSLEKIADKLDVPLDSRPNINFTTKKSKHD